MKKLFYFKKILKQLFCDHKLEMWTYGHRIHDEYGDATEYVFVCQKCKWHFYLNNYDENR